MKFFPISLFIFLAVNVYGTLSILPISMYSGRVMKGLKRAESRLLKSQYTYKTIYVTQRIDNFGFGSDNTYQEKVLYSDKHWVPGGPILFYAGNEGKVESFVENTGLIWDLELVLKGMVVFAEHRYYGVSLPFGNESFSNRQNLAYLTANQAMADYAMVVRHIKTWPGIENSKVIVFGGSYGGLLAGWLRMKYPNVFDGAIASSAPFFALTSAWTCDSFGRVATQAFVKHGSENCRTNIRNSWTAVDELGKTDDGSRKLASIFNICSESVTNVKLKEYMLNAITMVAMVNYPYPADFLAPLPGWPVRKMCQQSGLNDHLYTAKEDLLIAISKSMNVYYNSSGTAGACNDIDTQGSSDIGGPAWEFQLCSELIIPLCFTGVDDMFEPSAWVDEDFAQQCAKNWYGVRPNPNWTDVTYWGKRIESASNIVFANGLLDPWSAGGVLKTMSPYQPVVIIPDGAHHLELRAANPLDTPAAKAARAVETAWVKRWIGQAP